MICPNCKKQIMDGGNYCGECGALIRKNISCKRCGRDVNGEYMFCPNCGNALHGEIPIGINVKKKSMGKVIGGCVVGVFLIVIWAWVHFYGGWIYTCKGCGRKTFEAYYVPNGGIYEIKCKECAMRYYSPFPIDDYRVKGSDMIRNLISGNDY